MKRMVLILIASFQLTSCTLAQHEPSWAESHAAIETASRKLWQSTKATLTNHTQNTETEIPRNVFASGVVIDGLGRPLAGVTIKFYVSYFGDTITTNGSLTVFLTDTNGIYSGIVTNWSQCDSMEVDKDGYNGFLTWPGEPIGETKTITRHVSRDEMKSLSHLEGDTLYDALVEIMGSGSWWSEQWVEDEAFFIQDKLCPAFRRALKHTKVGPAAESWLDFIADPDDLRLFKARGLYRPSKEVARDDFVDAVQATAKELIIEKGEEDNFRVDVENGVVFNRRLDRVLVRCRIFNGRLNARGYALCLHKIKGKWVLKSIRQTWVS